MYTYSYSIPVTEPVPLDQADLAAISLHAQVATVHLTGLVDSCAWLDLIMFDEVDRVRFHNHPYPIGFQIFKLLDG